MAQEKNGRPVIKFAINDGHLETGMLEILRAAGLHLYLEDGLDKRKYVTSLRNRPNIQVSWKRPMDTPYLVRKSPERGGYDVAVSGADWWLEAAGSLPDAITADLYEPDTVSTKLRDLLDENVCITRDLRYNPTWIVLAVNKKLGVKTVDDMYQKLNHGKRPLVASEYPTLAASAMRRVGITDYDLVRTFGKTEGYLLDGYAILDVTETGTTIAQHEGMIVIPALMRSTPHLGVNIESIQDSEKKAEIDWLVSKIDDGIKVLEKDKPQIFQDKVPKWLRESMDHWMTHGEFITTTEQPEKV